MILKDKIIIVTGGSGLIGKAIIHDIQKKGGIAISADISVDTNLPKNTLHMDITNNESIYQGVDLIIQEFGHIDGLVNSAYPRTSDWGNKFEDIKPASWQKNVDLQLNSCFVICQKVLRYMMEKKNGSIVNIASIYGVVGNNFTVYEGTNLTSAAAYSAIKGGIINFTRYLASYYGKDNIRINCVSPGGIFDNQDPVFVKNYEHLVPLGRMGKPEDIAPAVSFLLSDEAQYITGHNLIVDGGWTAI
jgi:NAD(P)-dependent dehydrogenase (short-subunit alcohol dehydrogenase family)